MRTKMLQRRLEKLEAVQTVWQQSENVVFSKVEMSS